MIRWLRLTSLCVLSVAVCAPVLAQDRIIIGSVTASGATADVPVSIRDAAGTPLGADRPAGSKIQALSIKVNYSPASAVQSVSFSRAGITRNLSPIFETAPTATGTASLIVSFDEASNPIPFTLNGTSQVAHLVFTLSNSAAPSSSISLELDPGLTQLTDSGGTAATKETAANGTLELINGRIDIPALSISLSPSSRTIVPGHSSTLDVSLSRAVASATLVTLSSSNAAVATVPSSVTIPAGASSTTFDVTALLLGSATINASIGASDDTANITVAEAPVSCNTPAVPQLAAPAGVDAGAPYSITWSSVSDATEYLIEESSADDFAETYTRTVTASAASFAHGDAGARYFYRLRARNRRATCDVSSTYSSVVSVLVNGSPVGTTRILPVAGSVHGNFGSFFKTALQLHNPFETALSGRIVFHPAGISGTASDPSLSFTLGPRKSLSFDDLLPAMGIASGLGSADVVTDPGSPAPVALARVFNDAGAGTTGLGHELLSLDRALRSGDSGVLFAPDDVARFRLNIGIRTLSDGATVTITVRDEDGVEVKTATRAYASTFFTQVSAASFLDGYTLVGGETITVKVISGAALVYGATTDNITNDPSVQFATSPE
jgi:hypothetical protein